MKKITFLLSFLMLLSWQGMAQIATYYTFSESAGVYTPMTGGTVTTNITGNSDDGEELNVPIGFTLDYAGTGYSTLNIGVNGAISFTNNNVDFTNNLAGTDADQINIIAPLWDDLYHRTADAAEIKYQTTGVTPNQVFTVQWTNISWRNTGSTVSFQLVLFEGSNNIQFNYGPNTSTDTRTASIGLNKGNTGADFMSVTPGAPASASTSAANNGISSTNYPGDGVIYLFTYTAPACPDPTALTATNITATSADLGWTDPTGSLWDIEWGTTGFTPTGTPNITGTTTNPHNLTGLTAQTAYEFYVRTDCGGSGTSNWVGPFTFTTACAVITPNHTEPFATFLPNNCWDEADAGSIVTGPSSIGTSPWTTGTAIGNTARINLFTNTRSDWILSPLFNLTSGGYEVVIDVAVTNWNSSATDAMGSDDTVKVLYTEDNITWNTLLTFSATDNLPNTLTTFSALIPSTANNVQFAILATDGPVNDAEDYDFHIDNFIVRTPPPCPDPTALTATSITATAADLGWTDATGSLWDIEWGTTGFTPTGTPTITGTTTNPHNLTGLTAQTTYDFYVRSDCGGSGTSNWVGPFTFTTACASFVAPYLEEFNTASLPACWSETGDNSWEFGSINGTTPAGFADYGAINVADQSAAGNGTFIGMDGSDNVNTDVSVLYSPMIDVSPLSTPHLNYWVFSNNTNDAAQNKLIVELWDGANWVLMDSIQANLGANWVNFDTDISSLPITGDVQVRFTVTGVSNGGSTYYNDILIDDVRIFEPLPNDIGVIEIASTPTGCGLGMETVTIKVKNYGAAAQSNFDVVYALNSVAITPETVTATVNPGDTLTHVFTTLANMSTPMVYTIDAWTDLTTDGDNSNDTLNGWMTEHLASSLAYNDSAYISNTIAEGTNTIICTNGLVNNMLDSCYTLSALVIDSLAHTFNGDLDIWLISPAGDTLEVSTDNGGSTNNYINVTFTDTATTNIAGNNPVPGFYHTEELAGLAKFNGTDPNGAWTLRVVDDAGGDNGTLYAWHLEFTDHNFTVDLGTDTNVCSTDQITLNSGVTGSHSYSWSTGDNTQQITIDTNTLGGNGTYNISVVVTDTISGCQSIDTIVVNYSVCTGINAQVKNVNVNVYPNPNNGEFTLNVNTIDVNELAIKVVNIQGQEVYNKMNFDNINQVNEKIDLSDNADGIYFVIVTTDKGIVTHKMIVQ